ncbi:MAG TPA: tRNA glutamyl-Q(34) synthetase GluQRS [Candidatus Dormibacteraeota bacterium]|nr:tRNA glutamyl-Q(34) synthetase GluQRS [Candidatus Dormibacteraeota bacterium]
MLPYRGRFAPSPTGDLHLGSLATALVAWLRARSQDGELILRVEDLDTPRVVAGSEARQLDDLRWLGLDWDEGPDAGGAAGPYRQSERAAHYEAALAQLAGLGVLYLCDCSRAEIAQSASAPHAGEEGPPYPGTCRRFGMRVREWKRPPAVRLAVPERTITVVDAVQGAVTQDVAREVGDFVLKRGDGVYAYQLAVVVDDLEMGITEVVRGVDLLSSAPRQALLAEMLDGTPPAWMHVPLVLAADGSRLQKRTPSHTLAEARATGVSPQAMVARLARTLGLGGAEDADQPRALVGVFALAALRGKREIRLA